ncbi:MAG: Rpn family recombination-promoting nuclease/putative transposase [Lachnospiraceae bacterium]|nr:Rpn family recombination-promoting nuclease/putative transposase [Lachnospiraceae bacterium]
MKKTLQELTIKNNFLFAAVMSREDICRQFLEMVLGFKIERVEVDKEKSMVYNPQYKGVRLDIYVKDGKNTRYNVEMQARSQEYIGKRARYYHSQIDMDMLVAGYEYSELPKAFVIFVCDFDPFGERKYLYTFENRCEQNLSLNMRDERKTIFLSTVGENPSEVPKELVKFLQFVKADLDESMEDFEDDYIKKLQDTIQDIKVSREMERKFMTLEELIKDERKLARAEGKAEGKAEGTIDCIFSLLESLGELPNELIKRINEEKNLEQLNVWLKLAAKTDSIEQFMKEM